MGNLSQRIERLESHQKNTFAGVLPSLSEREFHQYVTGDYAPVIERVGEHQLQEFLAWVNRPRPDKDIPIDELDSLLAKVLEYERQRRDDLQGKGDLSADERLELEEINWSIKSTEALLGEGRADEDHRD